MVVTFDVVLNVEKTLFWSVDISATLNNTINQKVTNGRGVPLGRRRSRLLCGLIHRTFYFYLEVVLLIKRELNCIFVL